MSYNWSYDRTEIVILHCFYILIFFFFSQYIAKFFKVSMRFSSREIMRHLWGTWNDYEAYETHPTSVRRGSFKLIGDRVTFPVESNIRGSEDSIHLLKISPQLHKKKHTHTHKDVHSKTLFSIIIIWVIIVLSSLRYSTRFSGVSVTSLYVFYTELESL